MSLKPTKVNPVCLLLNSFLASCDFCRLLIIFANSLDPDQDQQIGSILFDTLIVHVFGKELYKELILKKADHSLPSMQRVKMLTKKEYINNFQEVLKQIVTQTRANSKRNLIHMHA